MTKQQIKVFEELINSPDFVGKKKLEWLLWRNTSKPKFKEGECFKVSDPGRRIFGYPVKGFCAQIKKIYTFVDMLEWMYEMRMEVTCGDKHTDSIVCIRESELETCSKCDDNKNELGKALSENVDMMEVRL